MHTNTVCFNYYQLNSDINSDVIIKFWIKLFYEAVVKNKYI